VVVIIITNKAILSSQYRIYDHRTLERKCYHFDWGAEPNDRSIKQEAATKSKSDDHYYLLLLLLITIIAYYYLLLLL
jgi:hypothetical protein